MIMFNDFIRKIPNYKSSNKIKKKYYFEKKENHLLNEFKDMQIDQP